MLKIIGLGNTLRGDDSVGVEIIAQLSDMEIPVPLRLVTAGADAFSLLEHLIEEEPVLIVDCAIMGKAPGSVVKIPVDMVNLNKIDEKLFLHGFSFAEIYKMAKAMGKVAPCTILAIEPENIQFNEPLSETVRKRIPSIINMVLEEAQANAA